MKRIFTLLLTVGIVQLVSAASGVFEYYLDTKLNGTSKNHGNYSGGTSFVGSNLGNVPSTSSTLIIDIVGLKTFKNGGSDVTAATLFYRVYKQGASAPAYTAVNMPFFANLGGAGDQEWQQGTDVNLLTAPNMTTGTYNVDVYITASTSDGGASYGSSGSPLTATFVLDVTLAANLTAFKGTNAKSQNILDWQTASEKNAANFDIQRSTNNTAWTTIGQVKAVNNAYGADYQFVDAQPLAGTNYYRLQMVDANGSTELSKIVAVNTNGNKSLQVYPNPAKDILTVVTDANTEGVSIFDINGRVVLSVVDKSQNVNIQNLASGVYFVRMMDKTGFTGTPVRFVKQ